MGKVKNRQNRSKAPDVENGQPSGGSGGTHPALGARIRDLRLGRNLTLADLAASTGISIGTLSQMERDLVSPTVRTLFTLSNALDVSPAWLIDPDHDRERDEPYIVRADQRQPFIHTEGMRKDLIAPPATGRLKAFYLIIEPGGGSGSVPYVHTGEEIGLVISGVLELRIEDGVFVLREGDCFSFPSDKPHSFSNIGTAQCTVFWVNADF
ncbi:transcriptional regulator, XRE family [Rhizobium sp. CF080]|uniref:helix-turn-helix domain-containing protein n=1 Tax=Rhizobium sp. (strain CF080) TaxID=1144310 RepID=UPI000271D6B0|nr:XRE family transcriptional regulator [Rhizobium sp. CF080]EUB99858.1 transcriptional regulator, XRE family [Rhizobium sp. CF080]